MYLYLQFNNSDYNEYFLENNMLVFTYPADTLKLRTANIQNKDHIIS